MAGCLHGRQWRRRARERRAVQGVYGRGKSARRGSITGFIGQGRERERQLGQSAINGWGGGGSFNSKTRKRGNRREGLRRRGGVGLHCSLNARMKEGGRREDRETVGDVVAVRD
jgi:hypothetical protein